MRIRYLSRLLANRGHHVVRVNYVGDWGRQFGLLGAGMSRFGSDEALNSGDAIRHLFQVYVKVPCSLSLSSLRSPLLSPLALVPTSGSLGSSLSALLSARARALSLSLSPSLSLSLSLSLAVWVCSLARTHTAMPFFIEQNMRGDATCYVLKANAAASDDPSFNAEARSTSERLEAGDEETIALWNKFRALSAASYDKVYARLGIEFDVLNSESMYAKQAKTVANALRECGILGVEENGAEIVDFTAQKMGHAVIVKEDGGSVYLTRDIAAAVDRKERLQFDKMIYVAGACLHACMFYPCLPLLATQMKRKKKN